MRHLSMLLFVLVVIAISLVVVSTREAHATVWTHYDRQGHATWITPAPDENGNYFWIPSGQWDHATIWTGLWITLGILIIMDLGQTTLRRIRATQPDTDL
jgi:hypothetical protein